MAGNTSLTLPHKVEGGTTDEITESEIVNSRALESPEVQIWCHKVEDFSSQYGYELSISYTMSNLEGPSSIYSQYGDFTQAAVMRTYGKWWMKCSSGMKHFSRSRGSFLSQDFVHLSFETSVRPTKIEIFETYNPGSVVRILACDKWGSLRVRWQVLWEGEPQKPPQAARIFTPQPLKSCPFYTNHIRIEFHHSHLSYYAELDAVRLTGHLPMNGIFPGTSAAATTTTTEEESDTEMDGGSSVDRASPETSTSQQRHQSPSSPLENENGLGNWSTFEACTCAFFRLPMEILKIIFDYLDLKSLCNLSSTCRFFYQHCYDEAQFCELDLQPYWHLITEEDLFNLSQRFKYFKRVDLSWCCNLTSLGFSKFLCEPKPMLTCLRLNCCPFIDCSSLEIISFHCLNLKELRLQSCKNAGGGSFASLASLKELRILDLYRTLVDTESIVKIVRSCQKLEQVNLGSCTNNTDCNRVAVEMSKWCPNLRSIDFWRSKGLTYIGLSALVRGCRLLEEMDLGWCSRLKSSDGCFLEVGEHCPNLKKLFATANRGFCNNDLDVLSNNCRKLEQLDVLGTREITNPSVLRLLERCQSLELLDLSFCYEVDYQALESALAAYPRVDFKRSYQISNYPSL